MVRPGQYEAVYNNMPEVGLAKASDRLPATGKQNTAKGRLQLSDHCDESQIAQWLGPNNGVRSSRVEASA
jgi:hypothetical protein